MTEEKNLMTDEMFQCVGIDEQSSETLVRPSISLLAGRRPETEEKQGGDDQPVFPDFYDFHVYFCTVYLSARI